MMRVAWLILFVVSCAPASPPPVDPGWAADSLARQVDPFIGTHGDGNAFPGPMVPWGLVAPSPHTRLPSPLDFLGSGKLAAAGYVDDDPQIHGFGLTHLSGVGCPDLGAPVIAVGTGTPVIDFDSYGATRGEERAWPGYYSVELVEPGVRVELSAGARVANLRFFGRGAFNVLVDVAHPLSWVGGGAVQLRSATELDGEVDTGSFCAKSNRQKVYFAARFDRAADATGNDPSGAWLRFGGGAVELAVGISYTSVDGARANLAAEPHGFDDARVRAQSAWEDALGRVRVTGGTAEQRTIFYTALYHALLHPSLAGDVDGAHRRFGGAGAIDTDSAHDRYHVFSLWDTYRTVHPLLALLYPERQREMVRSLLEMTVEAGAPPGWELAGSEVQMMVGDPADIVLADSAVKNVLPPEPSLLAAAWPILQSAALDVTSATLHRPGNASYRSLGYVPIEEGNVVWGPVSTTLEYALADFALGRLAAVAGQTIDPSLAAQESSWKNLVDPDTKLFRPRHMDGSFLQPFDPDALDGSQQHAGAGGPGFVEGSAWHYAFFAPHALAAHADATGGADAYVARAQSLFDTDRFVLWNEPDIGFPYLFTHFAGQGWRTAAAVDAARARFFTAAHDGLPGNDDCGALSAWYVFSALGLYPDVPAGDDYALGTPLFDHAELAVAGGTLVIESPHATPSQIYVTHAQLAGHDLAQRVPHTALTAGGTLQIDLSETPP